MSYCIDGVEGTATITSLGCESANGLSSHLTVGREYTMYCSVTITGSKPPVVVWIIAPNYSIKVAKNVVASAGSFTARFVKSDMNSIIASLTFTATASLDQKVIACQDRIGVSLVRDECRVQIGNRKLLLSSLCIT